MKIQSIFYSVVVGLLLCIFVSCYFLNSKKFDTEQKMQEKCKNLNGLDNLVLNKTTIDDMYIDYDKEDIKEEMGYRPNIDQRYDTSYSRIREKVRWKRYKIENYDKRFTYSDIELDFYNDTLVQISFRYESDSKQLPEYFTNQYGLGCPITEKYLDSLSVGYGTAFDSEYVGGVYRKYINKDIHMVISGKYWDVIICHMPKFYKMGKESAWLSTSTPRNDDKSSGHNSMDADDEEYWKSVNRERALKDAGLDDAAKIERNARINYLQGGGYSSPNGGSQVHYQGSKEQQEHLDEMKRRGW